MPWPEVVPILTEKDIHKGCVVGPNGSHCLSGWLNITFGNAVIGGNYAKPEYMTAEKALIEATGTWNYVEWNDTKSNSKAKIAKAWNKAVRSLGYVVPCDRPTGNTGA